MLDQLVEPPSPEIKDTFWKLRDMILALGDDVQEIPGQTYADYRRSTTFAEPYIQKRKLVVFIKMGDRPVDDPKGMTSQVNWYGKLNTRYEPRVDYEYVVGEQNTPNQRCVKRRGGQNVQLSSVFR